MSKTVNERLDAQGGVRVPGGAAAGLVPVSNASGDLGWRPLIFVQSTAPSPPAGSGEYIWYVTDGSGGITDIRSGVA